MRVILAAYYLVRRVWFGLFPRTVGAKGYVPSGTPLGATPTLPPAPVTWCSPRAKWGMLGNGPDPGNPSNHPNGVGDCVVAGQVHAEIAVASYLGEPLPHPTTQAAVAAYFSMTGGADVGLNPAGVLEEWERGTLPAPAAAVFGPGGPFVRLDPTNVEQIKSAIATFGWVGIGVNLQRAQEIQFSRGQIWRPVRDSPIVGGHWVVLTGYDARNVGPYTLSWAKGFRSTWSFVTELAVEAYTGILPAVRQAGHYVSDVATLEAILSVLPGA